MPSTSLRIWWLVSRRMTRRHQKLKGLLKELAELNWEILKANHQP